MDKNIEQTSANNDKTLVAGLTPAASSTPLNLIGKCLKNRYLIDSQIGSGGMSDIYRAKDLHFESAGISEPYVAIKVLLQQFSSLPEAKQVLIKEARKTQQLSHPNIIRVYDVDSHGGYHFMVMEWLDGESLDQIIKRSKPLGRPFKGTLKLIEQIGSALDYAHNVGIVHTDLKPSNIILTRQGQIKVFDFGVARALQLNFDKYAVQKNEHTAPLSGYTPAYASLEQLKGEAPCPKDDVYAFACIIYELLSGRHPYQRLAANKVNLKTTALAKPNNINFYLWLVLKKGLAINKSDRATDINYLTQGLSKQLWPKSIAVSVLILTILAGSQVYKTQEMLIGTLNLQVNQNQQQRENLSAYQELTTIELLGQLDNMPVGNELIKAGLLRKHQSEIINIVEQRIDNVEKDPNGVYKNYDEIEAILADALTIFPDSMRLNQLQSEQATSRSSIVDALSEKLNLLLLQGRYNEVGANSLSRLINDLSFLNNRYNFQPEYAALQLYRNNFQQALAEHNVKQITLLIETGELVFKQLPEALPLLTLGKEMKVSVAKLLNYQKQHSAGQSVRYPYQAATLFYKTTFDDYTVQLEKVNNHKQLIKLDQDIGEMAKKLPENFKPLLSIQQRIAASYLDFANILMEKRLFKTAQKLVKRGNELYAKINKVSFL